jgi:hypothetical protein
MGSGSLPGHPSTGGPGMAGPTNQGPGWGTVVGAGILGGMLGAVSAPAAPQPQIIIIQPPAAAAPPPQPPPPQSEPHSWWCTGSQRWYPDVQTCTAGMWTNQVPQPPPQAHRAQPAQKVIHAPISSCIGVSVSVAGDRLTLINKCGQAATVTWGSGLTQHGDRVTFTAEVTLPEGTTQVWPAQGGVSGVACPYGMHVIDAVTGQRTNVAYPDEVVACQ